MRFGMRICTCWSSAAVIQRMAYPMYPDDALAEWEAEDRNFLRDDDEIHAHLSSPRRKVCWCGLVLSLDECGRCDCVDNLAHYQANSFFSSAIEDSGRSEEHTSELQSLMRISYAVFCLKKKK